jgi:hypothetical protein
MASGPGTGVAAPPAEHIAKGTASDPALQAALSRALATNDQASLLAMAPTLQNAAQGLAITPQGTLAPIPAAIQSALPMIQQALAAAPATLPAQQQQALAQLANTYTQQPIQQHQAEVGRALVRRTTSELDPQLEAIRADLDHRSNQIQATSEHRRIDASDKFRRQVLRRLAMIEYAARIPRY